LLRVEDLWQNHFSAEQWKIEEEKKKKKDW
jgi:hypothetical protein